MISRTERACLVIADITGYTGYLAGTELDHAQDVLADLMDTVVSALRPSFRLAKLEGDAAFVYTVAETVDGSLLQDTVEHCYFAFRRRLRDIRQSSFCECRACILIPNLNLKVFAHHGTVGRQRIAGWEELVGSDVVVVHRLLKNSVQEATGLAAYALYTDACMNAMGADPRALGLAEHRESYDIIGEVTCWLRDLESAWSAEQERKRVVVGSNEALWTNVADYPAPPEVVWEYQTSPARRPKWQAGVDAVFEQSTAGRRGVGTTNHCMHGKDAIIEEILDWRPFELVTERFQIPQPGVPKITMSEIYEPLDGGRTRITTRVARPRSAKDRAAVDQIAPFLIGILEEGQRRLTSVLEAEMAARATAAQPSPEPDLPRSAARHLLSPISGPIAYVRDEPAATDSAAADSGVVDSAVGRSS